MILLTTLTIVEIVLLVIVLFLSVKLLNKLYKNVDSLNKNIYEVNKNLYSIDGNITDLYKVTNCVIEEIKYIKNYIENPPVKSKVKKIKDNNVECKK